MWTIGNVDIFVVQNLLFNKVYGIFFPYTQGDYLIWWKYEILYQCNVLYYNHGWKSVYAEFVENLI